MKRVYAYYCKAEEIVTGIGFIAIVALVFSSAIARGLKNPIQWTVDISQLLLAWVSFLGADIAWRYSQILGLDLFTRKLPARLRKIIELAVLIIIFIALIIFIKFGLDLARANWKRTMQVVRMSYGFVTLSLPVVSVSFAVSTIVKIVRHIRNFNKPAEIAGDTAGQEG
jgi:TRAP-type C4-dicarboxylate transport system permease small subunit